MLKKYINLFLLLSFLAPFLILFYVFPVDGYGLKLKTAQSSLFIFQMIFISLLLIKFNNSIKTHLMIDVFLFFEIILLIELLYSDYTHPGVNAFMTDNNNSLTYYFGVTDFFVILFSLYVFFDLIYVFYRIFKKK